jgi:hypothetical protein
MFSVILYMLRQTVGNRAPPLLFPSFSPLTVTFPRLCYFASTITWEQCMNAKQTEQRNYVEFPMLQEVLNLNSVNQLIAVMVKCGVLFEVRTEFLNNI